LGAGRTGAQAAPTALLGGRETSERLLWMPPEEDLAANLRDKHLPRASVDRAELFEDDDATQRFDFHGCRHTRLTLRAARCDNATELTFAF
jgi:hypothetical protein